MEAPPDVAPEARPLSRYFFAQRHGIDLTTRRALDGGAPAAVEAAPEPEDSPSAPAAPTRTLESRVLGPVQFGLCLRRDLEPGPDLSPEPTAGSGSDADADPHAPALPPTPTPASASALPGGTPHRHSRTICIALGAPAEAASHVFDLRGLPQTGLPEPVRRAIDAASLDLLLKAGRAGWQRLHAELEAVARCLAPSLAGADALFVAGPDRSAPPRPNAGPRARPTAGPAAEKRPDAEGLRPFVVPRSDIQMLLPLDVAGAVPLHVPAAWLDFADWYAPGPGRVPPGPGPEGGAWEGERDPWERVATGWQEMSKGTVLQWTLV